jgi:hypothetical protein
MLVLASIDPRGAVDARQLRHGVEGLVTMRATTGGRIGVLVEDSGISDDFGECIEDSTPRRLTAVVRERGARRFDAPQLLATPPVSCYHTAGRVLAGAADRLAIIWGVVPEVLTQAPTVQAAFAAVDQPFTKPATIANGLILRSAAFDADALNVAMVRSSSTSNIEVGPLFSQRFGPEAPGPLQPIDLSPAWNVLSDADPTGVVATAWQRQPKGDLLLSVSGG